MSRHFERPRLLEISTDQDGQPAWLRWRGRRERARVCNAWRVEGAWWQPPALPGGAARPASGRAYYTLVTASGAAIVVFRDDADGRWYLEQIVD